MRPLAKIKSWLVCHKRAGVILVLLGVPLYLPPAQVCYVRFFDPPSTVPRFLDRFRKTSAGERVERQELVWLELKNTPALFLSGVLMAEDTQFYEHHGFDWGGIKNSVKESRKKGTPPRGASTITQQCARSLFLWQGRSWLRKGLEAYYSMWMELVLPKRRIMELYVNVIEFGNGVYGLEAAARYHYNCHAADLTVAQISQLLAVMPSPRRWNPHQLPEPAAKRQKWLFDSLKNSSPTQAD